MPELCFPYSAVLFLEGGATIPDYLTCKIQLPKYLLQQSKFFPEENSPECLEAPQSIKGTLKTAILYSIVTVKVQQYSLQDIHEKQLYILIPYMPIRLSYLVQPDSKDRADDKPLRTDDAFNNAKKELTTFYQDIILILDDAVKKDELSECNQKDILALFRKAMIRIFHRDSKLLKEVLDMTAPVLEWERETIARLEREKAEIMIEKDIALAEKDSALAEKDELIRLLSAERDEKNTEIQRLLGRKKWLARRHK